MNYIGIDPGLSGAIAVLDYSGQILALQDMPLMAKGKGAGTVKNQINAVALFELIAHYKASYAVLEQVNAHPGQGVASMFSLGDSFGCIRSILACHYISTEIVTPQSWKKHYKLPADKEVARAKAIQLFPGAQLHNKKHHGRAEALLMAKYLIGIK